MHRIRLLAVLAFAALLLAAPARARVALRRRRQPGLRRRRQHRRELRPRLRRALQRGRRPRRPQRAGPSSTRPQAARRGRRRLSPGQIPAGHYYLVQLSSAAAIGAALPAPDADRDDEPGRLRRQGRPRHRRRRALLRRRGGQLLGGSDRRGLRRLRLGERLRGLGGGRARSRSSTAAVRADGGCTDTDSNPTTSSVAAPTPRNSSAPGSTCSEASPPAGTSQAAGVDVDIQPVLSLVARASDDQLRVGVLRRHAGADLRARHGRQQQRGRLRADGAPHRVHAGRPAARPREHRSRRRNARRVARRRRAGRDPDRARGRPGDRHDLGARSAAGGDAWPTTVGFTAPLPVRRSGPLLGDRHLHADRPVRLALAAVAASWPPPPRRGRPGRPCR